MKTTDTMEEPMLTTVARRTTTTPHTAVNLLPNTVTHLIKADLGDQDTVATINNKVTEIQMFVEEDVIL